MANLTFWLATVHWWYDWDWPAAEREFRRAIELEPNCVAAHQFYGWYLGWMGRLDDGLAEETYAQMLDPLSPLANGWLGSALLLIHQTDQAVNQLRMTIDIQPDYFLAHERLGLTYLQKGDMSAAIAELRMAAKLEDSIAEPLAMLGRGLAVAGQTDEAHMVLAELKERSTREFVPPYVIANVYAALGDSNQAFAWLDTAYAQRSYYMVGLRADSRFDSLRTAPRFTALLKKVGLES